MIGINFDSELKNIAEVYLFDAPLLVDELKWICN